MHEAPCCQSADRNPAHDVAPQRAFSTTFAFLHERLVDIMPYSRARRPCAVQAALRAAFQKVGGKGGAKGGAKGGPAAAADSDDDDSDVELDGAPGRPGAFGLAAGDADVEYEEDVEVRKTFSGIKLS